MVSVGPPSPLNTVYQQIDTVLPAKMCFYLPGTIGVFKTYNIVQDLYDISVTFKISLSGQTLKLSTDTLKLTGGFASMSSEQQMADLVSDHFTKEIPIAAIKGAYEFWHVKYRGPTRLWPFMMMTEAAFDQAMLKGKIPPLWNPVFSKGPVPPAGGAGVSSIQSGSMDLSSLGDLTGAIYTMDENGMTVERADGTKYNVRLDDA